MPKMYEDIKKQLMSKGKDKKSAQLEAAATYNKFAKKKGLPAMGPKTK